MRTWYTAIFFSFTRSFVHQERSVEQASYARPISFSMCKAGVELLVFLFRRWMRKWGARLATTKSPSKSVNQKEMDNKVGTVLVTIKCPSKSTERMLSSVSVHGCCLRTSDEAGTSWRKDRQRAAAHLPAVGSRQRMRNRVHDKIYPLKAHPSESDLLPSRRSPPPSFHTPIIIMHKLCIHWWANPLISSE